ncbi:hypothetical protein D3C80_1789650 [compost metagenome]
MGRIAQQVGDTEVHTAAPGEHLLADGALDRIGIALRIGFGKGDAHLHRAAGMHGVEVAEQLLTQGHHANEVVEDHAQFLFRAHTAETLLIGLAIG